MAIEPTRIDLLNHELRQIDHQMKQLHEWIAPVLKEINHLKCWRSELLEQREAEMRAACRVTRCEPGPGPDRRSTARRKSDDSLDPIAAKLKNLSAQQMADLAALLEKL